MAYTKQAWADGAAGGTPIDADALDHIEDGIEAAHNTADAAATSASSANITAAAANATAEDAEAAAATANIALASKANTSHAHSVADLPAGTTLTVFKSGASWPARPTARTDITVQWVGADPSPPIVGSGTGGMLSGADLRWATA